MSNRVFQTVKQGGPFALVEALLPKPGAGQVCIRSRAVSLNAIDWKNLRFGALIESWPTVLGIEGAGVVESVGDGVTAFKPGDQVMAWVQRTKLNGSFQDVFTANEVTVAKKPEFLSFEEATSLPIAYLTALAAIIAGLRVEVPGLSTLHAASENPPKSILVLGGSSGVGSSAIQLLRLALPSAVIVATASPAHHAHLRSLGASACLARSAQDDAAALREAAPGGVDAILDAVGAGPDAPAVFDALRADGPKLYTLVISRPGVQLPTGLQASLFGGQMALDEAPGAMAFLVKLLEEGKYKLPLKVEVVGSGFESVEKSLDLMPQVSGKKLVVSL